MNKKRNSRLKFILISIPVIAIIFLSTMREKILFTTTDSSSSTISLKNSLEFYRNLWFNLNDLSKTNRKLKDENDLLRSQLSTQNEIIRENEALKAELKNAAKYSTDLIQVSLLNNSSDNFRSVITVQGGKDLGIKSGMVMISSGFLIGRVNQVYDHYSQIALINDQEFRLVAISAKNRSIGMVKGKLGQGVRLERVAQNEKIEEGEEVISVSDDLIPAGIPMGHISKVGPTNSDYFKWADMQTPINLNKLDKLFIVVKK